MPGRISVLLTRVQLFTTMRSNVFSNLVGSPMIWVIPLSFISSGYAGKVLDSSVLCLLSASLYQGDSHHLSARYDYPVALSSAELGILHHEHWDGSKPHCTGSCRILCLVWPIQFHSLAQSPEPLSWWSRHGCIWILPSLSQQCTVYPGGNTSLSLISLDSHESVPKNNITLSTIH